MGLLDKIAERRYERKKKREEKNLEKFNQRQEEMDTIYKNKKQKSDFKSLLANLKLETYTKRLVAIIIFISIIDLQLSYILAFLDKGQIAESLSIQVCTTIIGTAVVYMIRAYFDTKAEKRDEMIKSGLIVDKKKEIIPKEILESKIREIIDSTGVSEHIDSEDYTSDAGTENPDDEIYG